MDSITGTTFIWPETVGGGEATFVCPFSSATEVLRSCEVGGVWDYFDETACGIILGELNALNESFANVSHSVDAKALNMWSTCMWSCTASGNCL